MYTKIILVEHKLLLKRNEQINFNTTQLQTSMLSILFWITREQSKEILLHNIAFMSTITLDIYSVN